MTTIEQSNKLPMKSRPVLKLKFGKGSAPVPAQQPSVPAGAKVLITEVVIPPAPLTPPPEILPKGDSPELNAVEIAGRAARAERQVATAAMRRVLIRRWPNTFRGYKRPKLPLKIGIHRDILAAAPELDAKVIKMTLRYYVSDVNYRKTLIEGAARIDLDGNAAGVVAPDEAYGARR